jgi:long-chain acyl-CoA synthetase
VSGGEAAGRATRTDGRYEPMPSAQRFENVVDLFEKSCKAFGPRDLFGVKKGGAWQWLTYREVKALVDRARGGLAALGVGRGDRVAIISNNRVEWAVLAYATYSLGAAFVPMYEAQHLEEWRFITEDCGAKVLVVSTKAIYEKTKKLKGQLEGLEHVLCIEGDEADPNSYAHLLKVGADKPTDPVAPAPKDTCNFIYTSGTTGKPKGVILSHHNIASNVSAVHEIFPFSTDDRSLSFLPWAHSFGHTAELHCLLSMGASMGLNTAVDKLIDELSEVQPTVLISVPRIFNRIYDRVNAQMQERPPIIRRVFRDAMAAASKKSKGQALSPLERLELAIADKVIFSKIRGRFGGRLKWAFSGGAALSREVAEFIDNLGIVVFEGYGLTETSPIATGNRPGARRVGSVGKAIPGVKIEIDKKAAAGTGDDRQGEVLIYGPNIMQGYHNRPEENRAVLMDDGGFRTGDLGYVDDDGFLFITGRIKEQYKLENGKYVAPAPLEEHLKLSPFIANVMIHGQNKPYNVALVVPEKEVITKFASEEGIAGSYEELLENERVRKKIEEELTRLGAEFRAFDKVKKFALVNEDFTVENEMLTPSLKLKRRNVLQKWGEKIEKLYT